MTVGDGPPALELTHVDGENGAASGCRGCRRSIRIAADAATIGRGADADVVLDSKQYPQMVSSHPLPHRAQGRRRRRVDGGRARLGEWDGGERRRRRLDARQARDRRGGAARRAPCSALARGAARHRARCGTASATVLDAAAEEEPSPSAEAAPPGWAQLESQVW